MGRITPIQKLGLLNVLVQIRIWVRVSVGVWANPNPKAYPKPLRVTALVEDSTLLCFSVSFRDKLEPKLRC